MAYWAHGAQAAPPAPAPPQVEVWSGGEAFGRIWSLYSGASLAPFGSVREDGFRVRGAAGYSDYGEGTASFADLLLGYHAQLGPLTLKAFLGITGADFRPDDPLSAPQGAGIGGKGVVEAWWNVTDRAWLSADLSWGWTSADMAWNSLHSVYNGRIRLGWRLQPELSAGLEGGAAGPGWMKTPSGPRTQMSPAWAASCATNGQPASCRFRAAWRSTSRAAIGRRGRSAPFPC